MGAYEPYNPDPMLNEDAPRDMERNSEPKNATSSFEEIIHTVIYNRPPEPSITDAYYRRIPSYRVLPQILTDSLEKFSAHSKPLDIMRYTVSFLALIEPASTERRYLTSATYRLLGIIPGVLAYWYRFSRRKERISTVTNAPTLASHFLGMLTSSYVEVEKACALDAILALHVRHGKTASPSGHVSEIIADGTSDIYSAVSGALSAAGGALHSGIGSASLKWITQFDIPSAAAKTTRHMFSSGRAVPGIGSLQLEAADENFIYHSRVWAERLARSNADKCKLAVVDAIESVARNEYGKYPLSELYFSLVYNMCGIPSVMFDSVSAWAQIVLWASNVIGHRSKATTMEL